MVKHWDKLLREIAESLPLEILTTQLDTVLGNLLWLTLLVQQRWTR